MLHSTFVPALSEGAPNILARMTPRGANSSPIAYIRSRARSVGLGICMRCIVARCVTIRRCNWAQTICTTTHKDARSWGAEVVEM